LPTIWSIDQTSQANGGSDNGFLDCARSHTPGFRSHDTTAACVNNLVACIGAGTGIGNIIGHGNDGLIVTGQGQAPSDPNKYISNWNERTWGPFVRQLKGKATVIKLWACHPGTGQAGADLLYAMAQDTNSTCMGPTGFLYCGGGGLALEPNSTWQVASPGQPKPQPINAPTPHFVIAAEAWSLRVGDGRMITLAEVTSVEVARSGQRLLSLSGPAAQDFLRLVDFANPLQIGGVPGAIVTAEIVVASQNGSQTFLLLNNRLLQSKTSPPTYYRCSEGLTQVLISGFIP
jgi:hypothetical protein